MFGVIAEWGWEVGDVVRYYMVFDDVREVVAEVARVRGVVIATKHKRRIPLAPKLGIRTVGWDWRE